MAEIFEVLKTDNDGDSWAIIKNDIPGTFPCGGEDATSRIWCFYCGESGENIDLMMTYSENQGEDWETPVAIIADIDEASLSFWIDEFGFQWISYFKNDKAYAAFHNPSDDPGVWTSKEVTV